jgi:hypothetical protein
MTTVEFLLSGSCIGLITAVILLGREISQARRRLDLLRSLLWRQADRISSHILLRHNGVNELPKKPELPVQHEVGTVDVGSFPEAWMRLCGKRSTIQCPLERQESLTDWLLRSQRNYQTCIGSKACTTVKRGQ